jgi:hypothetical protein
MNAGRIQRAAFSGPLKNRKDGIHTMSRVDSEHGVKPNPPAERAGQSG